MYLIPRLIGVCIYTAILVILALIIQHISKVKDICRTLDIYLIIVGLMGYFFVPPPGFDLPRLIERMQYYSRISKPMFVERLLSTLTPGELIYYRIIGNIPNADKLLPCISVLISFGFCFAILKNLATKKEDRVAISLSLMLFMARGGIMPAIDTIRAYMATAIVAWCVYQELCNERSFIKHLPLYIFACSMHAMGYAFLLLRLLYMFVESRKKFSQRIFVVICALLTFGISLTVVPSVWNMLVDKVGHYYEVGQSGEGYSYIWEGVLSAMSVLVAAYLLWYISKLTRVAGATIDSKYIDYLKYMKFLLLINSVSVFVEYNFFMRMGHYIAILTMPLVGYALALEKQKSRASGLKQRLFIISMMMLVLACARGYLCSLKFFV